MSEEFTVGEAPRIQRQIDYPDLTRLFLSRFQQLSANINCISVGQIVDFDPANQTATVRINYKRIIYNQNNPQNPNVITDLFFPYPTLVSCPVVVLSGGDGRITFPIKEGDNCLIFFNDRDIDSWFTSGQVDLPPNSDRIHDISDGIVLVGISPLTKSLQDYSTDAVDLIHGNAKIEVKNDTGVAIESSDAGIAVTDKITIEAGEGATFGSLYNSLNNLFDALITATISGSVLSPETIAAIQAAQVEFKKVMQ